MKTALVERENNTVKFTMDFTSEEFDNAVVKAYQETKGRYSVDGFRKGKAPRKMIERHYGEGIFFEDAINELFRTGYPEAVKELDIEVIDSPAADFSEIGDGKPLTVTITVPVYPVVEVKDYKNVEVEQIITEITEEDVNREIESLQKRNARMVVADRPVKDGDTVILDYAGFVGEEQFEGGTAENQELKIGSGRFIPGFEEQLIDAKAGDDVDVKVTFPEEYHAKDLAGKEAVFHCHIHEAKEEELPELDDEFAKDVSEYDTLDELRKAALERLQETADLQSVNGAKDKLIEKVYEMNKIEAPKTMIEDEVSNMIREIDQQLRYQGMGIDQYLQFTGGDIEKMREELRPEAEKRVSTRIVLRSIGNAENVEVTEEDLNKELERMAEMYKSDVTKVREMIGEESIDFFKKDIILTKVMDLLYDNAKINKVKAEDVKEKTEEK